MTNEEFNIHIIQQRRKELLVGLISALKDNNSDAIKYYSDMIKFRQCKN